MALNAYIAATADGFCRATGGLGVLVVTYMVGGLSAINAVAGAYSDDLPLLLISGKGYFYCWPRTKIWTILNLNSC